MFHQFKSYLKFLTKATNEHAVHSPFVYDLVQTCFYDRTHKEWYKKIRDYSSFFLNSKEEIEVQDFGAGSKKLTSTSRKISKIASNAGITLKRAALLGRMSNYFKSKNVLEIGTSLGIATASLSFGNPDSLISSLEGCENTAREAKNGFRQFNLKNIDLFIGDFSITLPEILKHNTFDLIFFDGNHKKEATIEYFEKCLPHVHNNTVFIFDDIYWSKGMTEAWNYIKNHEKVLVSIDTFYWGIVFFRTEQEKQHFTIRV